MSMFKEWFKARFKSVGISKSGRQMSGSFACKLPRPSKIVVALFVLIRWTGSEKKTKTHRHTMVCFFWKPPNSCCLFVESHHTRRVFMLNELQQTAVKAWIVYLARLRYCHVCLGYLSIIHSQKSARPKKLPFTIRVTACRETSRWVPSVWTATPLRGNTLGYFPCISPKCVGWHF